MWCGSVVWVVCGSGECGVGVWYGVGVMSVVWCGVGMVSMVWYGNGECGVGGVGVWSGWCGSVVWVV